VKVVLLLVSSQLQTTYPIGRPSKEIQAEIDALTDQLAATLRLEIADLTRQAEEGETKYQALLRKMVGRRIPITIKNDPLFGMEAIILKPCGKSKKPMHWWFRTTTGIETYNARTSFELLPLVTREASSESA